jgi:hypothetical protein
MSTKQSLYEDLDPNDFTPSGDRKTLSENRDAKLIPNFRGAKYTPIRPEGFFRRPEMLSWLQKVGV